MKTLLFSTALFASLSLPFTAGATTQAFSGQLCQRLDTSPGGVSYSASFGAHNDSTGSEVRLACPIPVTNPPATSAGTFRVIVYDRNPIQDVSCTLMVSNENGLVQWSAGRTTSGSDSAAKPLQWDSIGATAGTFYTMWCSVPVVYAALNAISHVTSFFLTN